MNRRNLRTLLCACWLAVVYGSLPLKAAEKQETPAERGFRLLTTKAYLPPDFTPEIFSELWKRWPPALRDQAAQATPEQRRAMAFDYYGLVEVPERGANGAPLGYVDNGQGGWAMNCLACHSGTVAGRAILGVPNSNYALADLISDVLHTKLRLKQPLGHMELGSFTIPLGGSRGTTNAVVFGVALESFRDKDLVVHKEYPLQPLLHHDLDAPPFWNVKKKTHMYYDAFVKKGHRSLLQFILLPRNGPETVKSWENDYRDILAWIESLEPPAYPWPVNQPLADAGQKIFDRQCAECHGTYGPQGSYPNRVLALKEVGTDPLRLQALTPEYRRKYGESWLAHHDPSQVRPETPGYLAPPLDGIWASAPYLHNGSVPTLWHLFHPDQRPKVWQRSKNGYDQQRVGLEVQTFDTPPPLPDGADEATHERQFFNTQLRGKSSAGHTYPAQLTEPERQAVLEYLKTL